MPSPSNAVSINEVVSNACLALGIENSDKHKVVFYEWAYQALSDIGITTLNLKGSTGTITTNPYPYFQIPSDCVHIDSIAIRKGSSGDVAYPMFDANYWNTVPDDDQTMHDKDYVVGTGEYGRLTFSSTVVDDGFTQVLLRYYSVPLDENGSPMIPEYYMGAITTYIEYMYVKSLRHKDRSSVPLSEIQMFYQQWLSRKADAISRRNKPEKPEIEAAISRWITMLPNQRGLIRQPQKKKLIG